MNPRKGYFFFIVKCVLKLERAVITKKRGEQALLANEIRQHTRALKSVGLGRADIYDACVSKFGKENETLINYVIQDEFPFYGTQNFDQPVHQYRNIPKPTNYAALSTVFGILSFFLFGIIFGPLAIYVGNKARENGESSTFGIVCGTIGLIGSLIVMVAMCSNRY